MQTWECKAAVQLVAHGQLTAQLRAAQHLNTSHLNSRLVGQLAGSLSLHVCPSVAVLSLTPVLLA
jgi:hypothetical protein